ncbi:hypothetical protein [Acinetobacter sp. SA01]|uniref:hypothetical protein n=1 Tax=Acinetobacter sp. SA01 TaxID=1862567 RepID=UPI00140DE46D|nr:hypothetical protein [Acinetobacter sp. SA01]
MSTKLGTLTLDLVAKIGNFTGPIKDAEKQTKLSFDNMRNHVNNYGAIAVAGVAAVGAGVFAMANEYANAARELQIFASISNTTTQEFQKMAVGAQTMGISQEQLSDQLKDFNEKLGEFITIGSGGAVDFFEQIAIKTEGSAEGARKLALEMQNLSGPQALQLYVNKLEEAGVTQQQMSFYLESMASDTTNLIPLLKDGGKGFEYWADAAERAGMIMDESAIAKANELKVQMGLLGLQVDGAKNKFIQGLVPALVSVGDGMSNAATETNLMSDAGETLGEVFKGVAATGMGVYAVVKMLSNAVAGLAVDAVNAKKTVDLAAEKGTWADKLPGVKFAKTAIFGVTMAKAPNSGVAMAAKDNAKVADDVASSIGRIYSNAVNQSVSAMAKIQGSQAGVTKGSDEWIKKQNEAAKATSGANKALQEQNQLLEQQKRDREQISKTYASDFQNMVWDEKEQQDLVKNSGFSASEQAKYLALVQKRFDAENAEYFKALNLEFNQYKWSEEKKLEYTYQMDREIAENDVKIADEVRESKLKFLDEQYEYQRKQLRINQDKELLETKKLWMSAGEYAQEYYALVREEILNTPSYSPEMKDAKIKQANLQQGMEQNAEREQVWGDYKSMMGLDESPYQQDMDLLAEARKQMLITEEEYQRDRLALQVGYGGEYLGALSGMFGAMLGESSSAYQALFFAQKSFYLAQAGMNVWKSASDAYANEPGTVWQKMGAAALATIESGSFLSLIEAATPMGMAHDGIDNIPKEGTWLLDKGERVVDSRTNADLKGMIANQKNGGDVHIQVNVTDSGVSAQSNQSDQKQLGQMIGNAVRAVIRQEQRQGGLLAK